MESNESKSKSFLVLPGIAVLIFLISAGYYFFRMWNQTDLEKKISNGVPVYFLLQAKTPDEKYEFGVLATLLPDKNRMQLMFVNPLTQIDPQEKNLEEQGAGDAFSSTEDLIQDILGRPVDYEISIETTELERIVDIMGGLPLYLDDRTSFSSDEYSRDYGLYQMSGYELNDYLHSPLDSENPALAGIQKIARIESSFLSAYDLFWSEKDDLPYNWIEKFITFLDSNFSLEDQLSLYNYLSDNHLDFLVSEIPGEPVLNPKTKRFYIQTNTERTAIAYKKSMKYLNSDLYSDGEYARTEVLNGTPIDNLARSVKSRMTDEKVKVLSVGNAWTDNFTKSIILDRSGNSAVANLSRKATGIESVYHTIRKDLGLDASIILGEEFSVKK